jgi:hypothetical protein
MLPQAPTLARRRGLQLYGEDRWHAVLLPPVIQQLHAV